VGLSKPSSLIPTPLPHRADDSPASVVDVHMLDPDQCELQRSYAAVLLRSDRAAEAQAMLTSAIATAREQESSLWELRASLDLARLWQDRGEPWRAEGLRSALLDRLTSSDEAAEPSEVDSLRALLATAAMAAAE
jgi:hypothetical protein